MVNPTEYVPKSYVARISTYWWLARWPYLRFILRELSSVFVAWTVVLTLLLVRAAKAGPVEYEAFQELLRNPLMVLLNLATLFFLIFHALTWFNLAPKAMVVRMRGKRVPGFAVAASNYVAWVVLSAAVAWILLRA